MSRITIHEDDRDIVVSTIRNGYRYGRLNLVLDPELKEWAHAYASRRHTTLTAIITEHLVYLRDLENRRMCPQPPPPPPPPKIPKEDLKCVLQQVLAEMLFGEDDESQGAD